MDTAIELYEQLNRKIDTASLNAALKDWLFKYPPPASRAIHFKIRYMTQNSTNPVSFLIFATRPDSVPESYVTYLKNRIREDLGFDKIPVQLEMKASRQKWEERFKN
jgi:GTP-binding protein